MRSPAKAKRRSQRAAQRGFRGLRKEPGRWPDDPPLSTALSLGDIAYFMRSGISSGMLTGFESMVAEAVLDRAKNGRAPSDWHRTLLDDRGVMRRCWDSDLDLWGEQYRCV